MNELICTYSIYQAICTTTYVPAKMWSFHKLLILFSLLSVSSHAQTMGHRSFTKEWKFQGSPTIKYGRNLATDDNSFLYVVCIDKPSEGTNCNVTIAKPEQPWNETKVHKKTCNLELIGNEGGEMQHEFSGLFSVDRFTKDRVIIVWWEREKDSQFQLQNIKVTILHMPKCRAIHLTFPIDLGGIFLLSNVIVYSNTFDVTVSNKALCGTTSCRITHDVEGRQIGYPAPFITNFAAVYTWPVSPSSPSKGFYICGSDVSSWKFRAMHVSPKGVGTNLMTVSVSDPRQVYWATSNHHELYGICLMGDKKVHCAQFDDKANVKMNATLNHMAHVEWIAVYNLAEGGILLVMGNCNNNKCRNFKVVKVHANGHHDKAVEVPGLHLRCSQVPFQFSVDVSENESDFCFYFACQHTQKTEDKGTKSSVKFASRCMRKENFNV